MRIKNKARALKKLRKNIEQMKQDSTRVSVEGMDSPCMRASGTKNAAGYLLVWARVLGFESPACAHVVSYMLAHDILTKSKLPRDKRSVTRRKQVHHLCAEKATTEAERKACRSCINEDHLLMLTYVQNMKRAANALKTHCKRGHALTGDNVYVNHKTRHCVACQALIHKRWHDEHRDRVRVTKLARYIRNRKALGLEYIPKVERMKIAAAKRAALAKAA